MIHPETSDARTSRPTRWLRFSLRTLLTVMLLVGAFCGGWMSHKRWGQVELEEARAEIEKLRRAPRVEYIDGLGVVSLVRRFKRPEALDCRVAVREFVAPIHCTM
jgi:hypothetical protein